MRKLLCLGCLLLPLIAQAGPDQEKPKSYRWVDKGGTVHFSSTPPPPGVKAEVIELRQPETVIHQENRERMMEQGRQAGESVDARQAEQKRLMQQIDTAKAELVQANEALISGEAPLPGELQRLAGGGSRLSESYQQRRAAEARRVEQLQQRLDELHGQLNRLR